MILIFSDKEDVHAKVVRQYLDKWGADSFTFDLDVESLRESYATFDGERWILKNKLGKEINLNKVSAVFFRRTFVEDFTYPEKENVGFKIWKGEWNKALLGIYYYLHSRKKYCLNNLYLAYRAENKYLQLEIAKDVGFQVPPYLLSNRKEFLTAFAREHGEIALKYLNQEFYPENGVLKGLYVNKIDEQSLGDFSTSGENPTFVQKYIEKLYEVRYTVVGNDHFACRIESQKSKRARIDWRRYDLPNTPHYKIDPPQEVAEKVRRMMAKLKLDYGAFDFIVSKEGTWYFLEINPMGQWLWIEDLTGLPISRAIARLLSNFPNTPSRNRGRYS